MGYCLTQILTTEADTCKFGCRLFKLAVSCSMQDCGEASFVLPRVMQPINFGFPVFVFIHLYMQGRHRTLIKSASLPGPTSECSAATVMAYTKLHYAHAELFTVRSTCEKMDKSTPAHVCVIELLAVPLLHGYCYVKVWEYSCRLSQSAPASACKFTAHAEI